MAETGFRPCPCCGTPQSQGLAPWHRVCTRCGYEAAALQLRINAEQETARVDEAHRAVGLRALRELNFQTVLTRLNRQRESAPRSWLDVGAAHGWFIQAAVRAWPAAQVLGLEPDAAVAQAAARRAGANAPIRHGFFPEALGPDEQFDGISFHDVFEHIESPDAVLEACARHLQPGGRLVLNLPSSRGVFYRLARMLARWGWRGPFERLWQVGLPSPHLHYFDSTNLQALLRRHGFETVEVFTLPSLHRHGLRERIAADRGAERWAGLWAGVLGALIPLINRLPSDIEVVVARLRAS